MTTINLDELAIEIASRKRHHAAWDECVGMLERAKDLAQTAEQFGQLETLKEVN